MVTWQLISNEVALKTWDEGVLRLADYSPFQSYAWGEYQRALGWRPYHWIALNEQGEIVAMMLGLMRRYPLNIGLIWCEGGPIGDLSACGPGLQAAIKETTRLKRIYCRFRCDRERHTEDALRLTAQGWRRSWFNLTTCYSMKLNLAHDENGVLAGCERNWRRNLNRAEASNLRIEEWNNPSVDEIVSTYESMQSLKGLDEQHSREEFEQLLNKLRNYLVVYRCIDALGQVVSLHGWLIFGKRATAVLSATTESGRELRASYSVVWALIRHCLNLKVQSCDLAGIDPVVNPGVFRFKKGTGAVAMEYLGEWDWASRPWLQWFGNWAISRRHRLKSAEVALNAKAQKSQPKTVFADERTGTELSQVTTVFRRYHRTA